MERAYSERHERDTDENEAEVDGAHRCFRAAAALATAKRLASELAGHGLLVGREQLEEVAMSKWRYLCCLVVTGCGGATFESAPTDGASASNDLALIGLRDVEGSPGVVPKSELTDRKGRRWARLRKAVFVPDEPTNQDITPRPAGRKHYSELTRDELAERLRPRTLYQGYEYQLATPDYEAADRARSGEFDNFASPPSQPDELPVDRQGQATFPPDARSQRRANTSFPYATVVWITNSTQTSSCTGTMIGRSTLITAAHCVHSGSGFFSTRRWAPAVDSQDGTANKFPYRPGGPFPSTNNSVVAGCYAVTVPGGWDSDKDVEDDYAVMEFSSMFGNPCSIFPGDQVGWQGFAVIPGLLLNGKNVLLDGYPGDGDGTPGTGCPPESLCPPPFSFLFCGGTCNMPQIWGTSQTNTTVGGIFDPGEQVIRHHVDTTGGQSGSGIIRIVDGNRFVVGVHKGYDGNDSNWGRHLTSDTVSFIRANSAL